MTFKYKKELIIVSIAVFVCLSIFVIIKTSFFRDTKVNEPIKKVMEYYNESDNEPKYKVATIKNPTSSTKLITTVSNIKDDEEYFEPDPNYNATIPYEIAPTFEDDGSIIYDGLTLTELTDKLNRSLNGYLSNTGYFFARYTALTGMDPYLSVAIVLLETGCKWTCSYLTTACNNIGGLKGGVSCNGGAYSKYETLDDGISGYLGIIYNNYYLKGMTTPETMASTYAASPTWAMKVNSYIEEIKNS
ncbi:MAG: glucosaminidase domain-containing protein [Bacilli bacterium]|nr:glucosaminidase domain-containing protein [Bacilli bacterium]